MIRFSAFAPSTLGFYIGKRFLLAILAMFFLCAVLIFMIDFVELLRVGSKSGDVSTAKILVIGLLRLPSYAEVLFGFTVLAGTIAALISLARKSELTIMRAGGMSVWQFVWPGTVVAFGLGLFGSLVFNPLAAAGRDKADEMFITTFGRTANLLKIDTSSGGSWIRQDGADGPSVIGASAASNRGLTLSGVTAFVFDPKGAFLERVDAARADLEDGAWRLKNGWVARVGREPEQFGEYLLSTYLSPERVRDALGTAAAVSFWDLPRLIEVAEKAKLSASKLHLQYESLWARPLLCVAMVLLAATVSLRSFRMGGIQTMVLSGMIGGFGFFLFSEISRQVGAAGLASPQAAIWLPVVLVMFVSTTVLLHQEDG